MLSIAHVALRVLTGLSTVSTWTLLSPPRPRSQTHNTAAGKFLVSPKISINSSNFGIIRLIGEVKTVDRKVEIVCQRTDQPQSSTASARPPCQIGNAKSSQGFSQHSNCSSDMTAFVPQPYTGAFLMRSNTSRKNRDDYDSKRYNALVGTSKHFQHLSKPKKRTRAKVAPVCSVQTTEGKKTASKPSSRVAVLVSGGGRSLENLCEKIEAGSLTGCRIEVVIASKKTAGAIPRAEMFGIPTRVVRLKDFGGVTEDFSEAVSGILDDFNVDLVIMAGWMHFYQIPSRYEGKVINIHPSLIPAFCGKGLYGDRVHKAVIKFGAKMTGCTVHLADNQYDHGPIILQKAVPVLDTDTADELAARVFESEKNALPEAVQLFVDGRLSIENGVVKRAAVPQSSNV